ncbi:MAG: hypothetical protein RIF36_24345 [Imperialibacter sp.]|uniref:hypothetical protein n=1 Tax=Imperialibacter sp. TaxID=2038411 RepID=UPI0032EBCC70
MRREKDNALLFLLLNPFLGFVHAFKYNHEKWSVNAVWLFVIFYGFTMAKPEGMDSSRYVQRLKNSYYSSSWESFAGGFYTEEGAQVDLYEPTVIFLMSRFTDSGDLLFAVFGLVFGYFYSRNLWMVLRCVPGQMTTFLWIIFLSFALIIPFWHMNGVRMWTAAHVFAFGVLNHILYQKRNAFIFIALSVLFHFSFVIPVVLFFCFRFFRLGWPLLYYAYIFSFAVSELNVGALRELMLAYSPEFLIPRVQSYTGEVYIDKVNETMQGASFHIIYYRKVIVWTIVIFFSFIFFKRVKNLVTYPYLKDLFAISLIILSFGNIASLVPSGGRFLSIGQLFAFAFIFLYLKTAAPDKFRFWFRYASYPMLFLFLIVSLRISLETITVMSVLGNPVFALLIDLHIPIISLFN